MESGRGTVKNPVYAGVGAPWKQNAYWGDFMIMKRVWGKFMDWGKQQRIQYQSDFCALVVFFLVVLLGGIFMRNATIARIIVAVYAACIGVLMLPAIIGRWPAAFRGAVRNPEAVRKARISVYLHLAIGAFHCVGMLSALLLLFLP